MVANHAKITICVQYHVRWTWNDMQTYKHTIMHVANMQNRCNTLQSPMCSLLPCLQPRRLKLPDSILSILKMLKRLPRGLMWRVTLPQYQVFNPVPIQTFLQHLVHLILFLLRSYKNRFSHLWQLTKVMFQQRNMKCTMQLAQLLR